ncbi:4-hydroxythreonine-4-phosphate dehydrogenase PdxA [Candidatus Bathyarchaeota archaeon ex4484_231]|nr:MAG: 4-hydroxythreonine-4-phosphate dehydrogenase PdxA [Candidatus Bathyarchaeota archaeon ex4484_231]
MTVKALLNPEVYKVCSPVVIGDLGILKQTAKLLKYDVSFNAVDSPQAATGKTGIIDVVDLKNVDLDTFKIGKVSVEAGRAAIQYIEKAVKFALEGSADAIATSPINKQAIRLAGSPYIGHTEMLGALCGVENPLMMFHVKGARIFFLTRHVPLAEAVKAVKKNRIVEMAVRIDAELRRIGVESPLIAVAALNPHASDKGLVGNEEAEEIIPAVEELRNRGLHVVGPVPADTVFHKALQGSYDAVLSLYHDQGHIAAKTVDFYGTVSVTLGLPFLRTSVDHGTAYDIAGKGVANPRSLVEAIKLAAVLVKNMR